ncbi:MAG TPA: aminotransferase class I/II-fold pyridoxal phosphate-dependent enzyme [Pseudonocardia sp.]|jgi:aspartate/methionine/tyrosine aminotransferase|uniref:aminotransferase class I/II-fold pyridoxal phosphate-dependent enzyme n=1 Tax=Pseudonocardia sp. TaxID=60912 RepID=UPI002B4B53D9|nr:aminotransferase class I/II-fold pyridoxal phosphate-dependent enzyme [Pseudonocardia sp.]HLU58464.1 aminotransferase class I/II-fold pyridoxal phosphate-dependent enzyme [Pseudonocardia sp.]
MQPVPPTQLTVAARAAVPPFHVMDVWAAAAERQRTHGDLVNLSAGQPSTPAPAAVRAAAAAALDGDVLGYTVALGIPELREAIAAHYERTYGLDVPPEQVVVTTGSSGGFLLAFLAAFDAGDRVALARPGYPCYRNILTALGCEVVDLPCGPQTRYQPTVEMLEALDEPVRGLVVASPANPTGTVLDAAELAALAEHCERTGVQLISDEIYHGISYAGAPATSSAWETSREAVVVNSFSKYFSMTGWRLGWLLVPPRLLRAVDCLTGNFTICPPALAQRAALAAFEESSYAEADGHVARYAANRELLLDGLADLGITRTAPADGAFYVYADVSHLTDDSMGFTHRLLAETGVAVAPGVDFDPVDGGRFIRMSFAGATADIKETLARLEAWLPKA